MQILNKQYAKRELLRRMKALRDDMEKVRQQVYSLSIEIDPQSEAVPVETEGLTFGMALVFIKKGNRVTRACWRNNEVYLWLLEGTEHSMNEIRVQTIQGKAAPWMPNHTELLAEDWNVIL